MTVGAAGSTVPNRTEVDGVTTFWLPAEGPLTAALVFRVGRSDELLAWAGVCHLVEHLSIHAAAGGNEGVGGFVDHSRTAMNITGSADEVVGFFARLTSAISSIPADRLDSE